MTVFSILLFDGFETLDAFGPAEIIGKLPKRYALVYASQRGGMVESSQGVRVETRPFAQLAPGGVVLVPGGMGTRALVEDVNFLSALSSLCQSARYVLSVCTGSALLARAGLMHGKRATSNKRAFDWVAAQDSRVLWQKQARWVREGSYYTSSGVSAGIDMTLGFIADMHGKCVADDICGYIEYVWNEDAERDPFALP